MQPEILVKIGTTTSRTYLIDRPCPRLDPVDDQPDDEACRIAELDHYGQPTGELMCYAHIAIVGGIFEYPPRPQPQGA